MLPLPRRYLHLSGKVLAKAAGFVFFGKSFKGSRKEFEKKIATYLGVAYAFGVSSARKGLALALEALGIKPGDEIIVADLNYYAIPALIQSLGIRTVFVDVSPKTGNINLDQLAKSISLKTKAVMVTHLFGRVCNLDKIIDLTKANNLFLIEDCAQALGVEYKGKKAGSFGDIALFSFGLGKDLICFGGGMITVTDSVVAGIIEKKMAQCHVPSRIIITKEIFKHILAMLFSKRIIFGIFVFPLMKFFYLYKNINLLDILFGENPEPVSESFLLTSDNKLSDFQAAVGLEQIPFIDQKNQKRIINSKIINQELADLSIALDVSSDSNIYSAYKILVAERESFRKKMLLRGVDTQREDIHACSKLSFINSDDDCPLSLDLSNKLVGIPNYFCLTESRILKMVKIIRSILNET